MALLKPSTTIEKIQMRITIDAETAARINAYCNFASIKKVDEFFEQAAEFVMTKDKDWQRHSERAD